MKWFPHDRPMRSTRNKSEINTNSTLNVRLPPRFSSQPPTACRSHVFSHHKTGKSHMAKQNHSTAEKMCTFSFLPSPPTFIDRPPLKFELTFPLSFPFSLLFLLKLDKGSEIFCTKSLITLQTHELS